MPTDDLLDFLGNLLLDLAVLVPIESQDARLGGQFTNLVFPEDVDHGVEYLVGRASSILESHSLDYHGLQALEVLVWRRVLIGRNK